MDQVAIIVVACFVAVLISWAIFGFSIIKYIDGDTHVRCPVCKKREWVLNSHIVRIIEGDHLSYWDVCSRCNATLAVEIKASGTYSRTVKKLAKQAALEKQAKAYNEGLQALEPKR